MPSWGNFGPRDERRHRATHSVNFLDLLMQGVYTRGSGGSRFGRFIPTPAVLRVSINQSGSSLSEAVTLTPSPNRRRWCSSASARWSGSWVSPAADGRGLSLELSI